MIIRSARTSDARARLSAPPSYSLNHTFRRSLASTDFSSVSRWARWSWRDGVEGSWSALKGPYSVARHDLSAVALAEAEVPGLDEEERTGEPARHAQPFQGSEFLLLIIQRTCSVAQGAMADKSRPRLTNAVPTGISNRTGG